MMTHPIIKAFFDDQTSTYSYLVSDPNASKAAIIDPVLNYDHKSGKITTQSADEILKEASASNLHIEWVLETHAHADHLSAAIYIKNITGAKIGIGEHIDQVQKIFRSIFNMPEISCDGSEFDHLFKDKEQFNIGKLVVEVIHTPGHTPACISYKIDDMVFLGDTLFMPDYGTARTDFPGGSAEQLFRSIQKLLSLPDDTKLMMCHDYLGPNRKEHRYESTVLEQKTQNIHLMNNIDQLSFIELRTKRDVTLAAPVLLLPSVQVNVRAGRLPNPESNQTRYLKIPLKITNEKVVE